MKTIVIDREIPVALFCKAFRHHVESNTLANETVKSGDSFWYGEIHEDGEFEMGYHMKELQQKHGTYIGTRKSEIRGKVICESGKTTIQYSRTLAGWLPIVLIPLVVGIALAISMISEYKAQGELREFIPALCFVTGMLIGFLLSPVKKGKITLFSNNMIGSKNGSKNSAADMLLGGHKN